MQTRGYARETSKTLRDMLTTSLQGRVGAKEKGTGLLVSCRHTSLKISGAGTLHRHATAGTICTVPLAPELCLVVESGVSMDPAQLCAPVAGNKQCSALISR